MRSRSLQCLVLCLTAYSGAWAADWKLEITGQNVRVYSRPVRGSGILELRGVAVLPAKMEVLAEVFRDTASFPHWLAPCRGSSLISRADRNTMTICLVLGMPPGIRNREFALRASAVYELSAARAAITLQHLTDYRLPAGSSNLPMKEFRGDFVLEYLGRNRTKVVYTSFADPGINVSDFFINYQERGYPLDTLRGLSRMAALEKYRNKALGSEDRLLIERILADRNAIRKILLARLDEYIDDPLVREIASDPAIIDIIVKSGGSYKGLKNAFKTGCLQFIERKYRSDPGIRRRYRYDRAIIEHEINSRENEREFENIIFFGSDRTKMTIDQFLQRYAKKLEIR
ncbi:MAG: hypothetical protein JXA07_11150 [Spirochaetes bacterium]|nr:hypothetical protein [Spirochaetota bacterium]